MGVELDISELAVLRPIQTTASSGDAAVATPPRRGSDDGPDADDTGCVTPMAAMSSLLPRQAQGGLPIDAAVIDAVDATFTTPTSSACLLRPATVCPPAPRKPATAPAAAAKRKRCCDSPELRRCFFPVPQDLSTVFLPRGPADRASAPAAPPPPRAAKKIRRLFVVG
ncbi:unnamed protein product [Urochloa humidicola]